MTEPSAPIVLVSASDGPRLDTRVLARARELWLARDEMAEQRNVAPGRTLPDAAIVNAAPRTESLSRRAMAHHLVRHTWIVTLADIVAGVTELCA